MQQVQTEDESDGEQAPTNNFADPKIVKEDLVMALIVVKHCVKISCTVMKKSETKVT